MELALPKDDAHPRSSWTLGSVRRLGLLCRVADTGSKQGAEGRGGAYFLHGLTSISLSSMVFLRSSHMSGEDRRRLDDRMERNASGSSSTDSLATLGIPGAWDEERHVASMKIWRSSS